MKKLALLAVLVFCLLPSGDVFGAIDETLIDSNSTVTSPSALTMSAPTIAGNGNYFEGQYSEGTYLVTLTNGRKTFVDMEGEFAHRMRGDFYHPEGVFDELEDDDVITYSNANTYSQGRAVVQYEVDGLWYYVDHYGRTRSYGFEDADMLNASGYARVVLPEGTDAPNGPGVNYVNTIGNLKAEQSFLNGRWFFGGRCAVEFAPGQWGYINTAGVLIIPGPFLTAFDFSEGMAPVEMRPGEWYYIEPDGMAHTNAYEYAYPFENGAAYVLKDGEYYFMDHRGKMIEPPME